MNLQRNPELLVFIGVCIWSGATLGQQIAERPDWKAGDYWQFRQTIKRAGIGDDEATTWSRKIVGFLPEDRIQVKFGSGRLEQYDSAMNFIPKEHPDRIRLLAKYPLTVGASWPWSYKWSGDSYTGMEHGSARVIALESITVPAGSFSCYRIDSVGDFTIGLYWEKRSWSRWYCPEVKWIGKERLETAIHNNSAPGGTTITTSELIAFTPGN